MDDPQLQPEGGEVRPDRLVAADEPPADLVARPVTSLVGALTQVAAVPPAMARLDAQPDGRPGKVALIAASRKLLMNLRNIIDALLPDTELQAKWHTQAAPKRRRC